MFFFINYIVCIRQPPIFKGGFLTLRVVLYAEIYSICEEIAFAWWITTDRTEMINQTLSFNKYLKLLMTKLMKLLSHSFITKKIKFFRNHKQFLENGTVICLMDFIHGCRDGV